jgi:hypothetical protein
MSKTWTFNCLKSEILQLQHNKIGSHAFAAPTCLIILDIFMPLMIA